MAVKDEWRTVQEISDSIYALLVQEKLVEAGMKEDDVLDFMVDEVVEDAMDDIMDAIDVAIGDILWEKAHEYVAENDLVEEG